MGQSLQRLTEVRPYQKEQRELSGKSKLQMLLTDVDYRASYLRAKLAVNIPSQIRALRRRQDDMTQIELAEKAGMLQSRISTMERPGSVKFNIETLIRLAAAFRVGLLVKFVPFSEVVKHENSFAQDEFDVTTIENDSEFLYPTQASTATPITSGASRTGTTTPIFSRFDLQEQDGTLTIRQERFITDDTKVTEVPATA